MAETVLVLASCGAVLERLSDWESIRENNWTVDLLTTDDPQRRTVEQSWVRENYELTDEGFNPSSLSDDLRQDLRDNRYDRAVVLVPDINHSDYENVVDTALEVRPGSVDLLDKQFRRETLSPGLLRLGRWVDPLCARVIRGWNAVVRAGARWISTGGGRSETGNTGSDRLNVLFLTRYFPTSENPISKIFVRAHARAVATQNNVAVIHLTEDGPDDGSWQLKQETDPSLTKELPTYRFRSKRNPYLPQTSDELFFRRLHKAYNQFSDREMTPDIIHAQFYETGDAAHWLGDLSDIPVVFTEQLSMFPRDLLDEKEIDKARRVFEKADKVMPVSKALQEGIEQHGIDADFEVVPNTVDPEVFYPPENGSFEPPYELLFVGRLEYSHVKGFPDLVEALEQLKDRDDWRLTVLGDGPAKNDYENQLESAGIRDRVTFGGTVTKQDVAEHMRKSDLFVLPSRWDNCPCVLIEALASGLPTIASRTGGIPEILKNGDGKLVQPESPDSMSNDIIGFCDRASGYSREQISERARKRFGLQSIGRTFQKIYSRVI